MFQSKTVFALLALTSGVSARIGSEYPESLTDFVLGRRELGDCHNCDCFGPDLTNYPVVDNGDGTIDVTIPHCKSGTISWMCCTEAFKGETPAECDVLCGIESQPQKCETVATGGFTIRLDADVTSFTINTHDGRTEGKEGATMDPICGGSGEGATQGGGCASKKDGYTAHCLNTFDLCSDFGYCPSPTTPVTPVASPVAAPTTYDEPTEEDKTTDKAYTKGDPHFKTFGGEMYDYHGECDLFLLNNPQFKEGLGMDIHIRTKITDFWSSVSQAVVKIGEDTLEIDAAPESNQWLWLNGKEITSEIQEGKWNHAKLAGLDFRFKSSGGATREALIYLGGPEVLKLKTYKDFVRVDVNWKESANYAGSLGLLGSRDLEGARVGRDGKTVIEDYNEFGQEWQIREDEPQLFHSYEGAVVAPNKCVLPPAFDSPEKSEMRARRLAESNITAEDIEKACGHLDGEEKKGCEYDVIATQDLNMASVW